MRNFYILTPIAAKIKLLKLKFLLPFPLILIAFAIGGESLTNRLLNRSYSTVNKLRADTNTVKVQLAANLIITKIEIEKKQDFTNVEITTTNSRLKKLQFKVPLTELSKVKAMIAQNLKLYPQVEIQANTPIKLQTTVKVLGILAEIKNKQGLTKLEVKTVNSILKKLEFELPTTELSHVQAMIVQELRLSLEDAKILLSYRIKN